MSERTRVLDLESTIPRADRPGDDRDDLCFTPQLVAAFINAYTTPGDLVFDPFAGFGTTLATAERLGRAAVGFEIDPERCRYARSQVSDPSWIRQQDVRDYDWTALSEFTLSRSFSTGITRRIGSPRTTA